MIEKIYSAREKSEDNKVDLTLKLPKNIRQVGYIDDSIRIYVEDYVMTFIKHLAKKSSGEYKIAVLLGRFIKSEGIRNVFISGAVEVKKTELDEDGVFTNEDWSNVYTDIKEYFKEVEILGWYLTKSDIPMELNEWILKNHIDNFAGQDKTLLLYDCFEKEETFYIYEGTSLIKQKGYYIYYERNEEMQTYMVECKKPSSEDEVKDEDRAVKEIRAVIEQKKEPEEPKQMIRFLYGISTCLAIVVLVIAAAMLSNMEKVKSLQQTINNMVSDSTVEMKTPIPTLKEEETTGDKDVVKEDEDVLTQVDTIDGKVEKIEPTKEPTAKPAKEPTTEPTKEPNKKPKATKRPEKKEITYHTVIAGETLADISYKYYKSTKKVDVIMQANEIENQDYIKIGQKLIIP